MKTTILKIPGRLGITDLKGLHAFVGNSQGDHSATNSIEVYKSSGGWMSFVFNCPMTEEAIAAEIKARRKYNEDYIARLVAQGRFGEEYTSTIELVHNPALDDNPDDIGPPLSSYKMIFFDP